jgi:tetratricopeptide (TPR) repeat protein
LYVQRYQDGIPKNPAWLDKAASCFQQAIQRNRAYYKDYQRLAEVYDLRNDMINADHMYHLAVERYPGSGQLWLALGRLAEKRGDNEGAVTYYTQAVAIEDAFQRQFRIMYPDRDTIIHRMGDEDYRLAQERIEVLSGDH